jgi:FKBP-type peptidyl-prolyl cis-trans isomerase FklB
MRKLVIAAATLTAAGLMLLGEARAQQTPAATQPSSAGQAQPAPAAKAQQPPAPKAQQAPGAKPGQATRPKAPAPLVLKTPKDKASYAIGMNVGTGLAANLRQQSVEVDQAILLRGLKDALAGGKMLMTEEEERTVLTQLTTEVRARMQEQQEKMKLAAEASKAANKKEGEAFLAANKAQEGVVTLPSGLQYKILTEGTGPKPTASDTVVCNYRGTLIAGKEFDSSYKRGQPATFQVNGVIKGWTEALQLMPVGSKWQLFIPSDLAYGDGGRGPDIGPGATLVFEVELLSIQGKDTGKDK